VEGRGGKGGGPQSVVSRQSSVREVRELQARCGAVRSERRSAGGLHRKGATPARGVGPVWGAASNETCRQEPSNCCLASGSLGRFGALTGLSLPGAPRARCGSWAVAQAPLRCSALRCAAVRRQKTARRAKWSGAEQGASSNKQQATSSKQQAAARSSSKEQGASPLASSHRWLLASALVAKSPEGQIGCVATRMCRPACRNRARSPPCAACSLQNTPIEQRSLRRRCWGAAHCPEKQRCSSGAGGGATGRDGTYMYWYCTGTTRITARSRCWTLECRL
jgi:hypothetical protein